MMGPMTLSGVRDITDAVIDDLLQVAALSDRGKAMALLHENEASPIQELVIAWAPGSVVDRHATTQDSESIMCLKGSLEMAVFMPDGSCSAKIHMTPPAQGGTSGVRLSANTWIAYQAGPEGAVLLEHACGPFSSTNTRLWPLDPEEISLLFPAYVDPSSEKED